jgi:hypothetical protein
LSDEEPYLAIVYWTTQRQKRVGCHLDDEKTESNDKVREQEARIT